MINNSTIILHKVFKIMETGVQRIRNSLTMRQKKFLLKYQETFSMREAVKAGGYTSQTVSNMLRKDSLFTRTFRELQKNLEQDPRLTKISGVEKLLSYQKAAEEAGDIKLAVDIQKEINKMIQGNIAPTKSIEEKTEKVEVMVIDFTKRMEVKPATNVLKIDEFQTVEEVK